MDPLTLISQGFEKKVLLNKELLEEESLGNFLAKLEANPSLLILNKEAFLFSEQEIDWREFDQRRVNFEMKGEAEPYFLFLERLKQRAAFSLSELSPLKILFSSQNTPKKYEVKDFMNIFVSRYKFMESLLRNRQELTNMLSINKILNKREKETFSLIGLVSEVSQTKSGNLILTLEDLTGQIKVLVSKNKKELYAAAKELVPDEVIGLTATLSPEKMAFGENIVWPEVPANKELKKAPEETYVVFLSDIHVGSANFLEEEFNKFLAWLRGETGNEKQKEIAQKIKYLFIVGDLVDGAGVYPEQDKELLIKDIYQQYQAAAELLRRIPAQIQIIICPGNHDALHLAEPQPAFNPKYIQPLLQLKNVTLVGNPAGVNIGQSGDFSGFEVLLYHGYSFDYYVANVDPLRSAGGYKRADLIMKFLLRKRHLAPSFGSTPYLPTKEDDLIIRKAPDFFVTGHIHYAIAANYRGITMISGSCWQSKTSFQEKVGHEPQPARVPLVNLQTREVKILKFM